VNTLEYARKCVRDDENNLCDIFMSMDFVFADHSGRAVYGMNRLRLLEHWGRGFETRSRHEWPYAFILCLCYSV
jgi:hypothetical protein